MENRTLQRALLLLVCASSVVRAAIPAVTNPLDWPWGAAEQEVRELYPSTPEDPLKNHYDGALALMDEHSRMFPFASLFVTVTAFSVCTYQIRRMTDGD
jgi:hypothetical protein